MDKIKVLLAMTFLSNGRSGTFRGTFEELNKGSFAGKPYFSTGSLSFIGYDEGNGIVRFEENAQISICKYEIGRASCRERV